MNGGNSSKTEAFKLMTNAYKTLLKEAPMLSSTPKADDFSARTTSSRPGFGRRRGEYRPPPPHLYNVQAWQAAHYGEGSSSNINTVSSRTDYNRVHPTMVESSNRGTGTSFMSGMENNKTYQHTQRVERRENDRLRSE
jgi:hypothetical protein